MSAVLTIWWVWMAAALVLAILEIMVPGFIFLGFAIGAAIVGIAMLGPLGLLSPSAILLVFAIASLLSWLGLRHYFKRPGAEIKTFEHDIND